MRTRAWRRHKDWAKAIRGRRIDRERSPYDAVRGWLWYQNLHEYSKGKIFCGCPLCRSKVNNKGRHRNYFPSKNWGMADTRRLDEMVYELKEEADE